MIPTFEEQQAAWSNPPLDDVGYVSSSHLLKLDEGSFRNLITRAITNRYRHSGWRNHKGLWRRALGLDHTTGRRILDYGCGAGFEALQYAARKNRIWLADISPENLAVASRTLATMGYRAESILQIQEDPPFCNPPELLDVIHCSGVLHHIPKPKPVVKEMAGWLDDDGELRLMVYSEKAWERCTETKPPKVVETHPRFQDYVRCMDGVGGFADWYDQARLEQRFGKWFKVEKMTYLNRDETYLAAILKKR